MMVKRDQWTIKDEIDDVEMERPHVVILGAGASVAALPNGDKMVEGFRLWITSSMSLAVSQF